MGIKFAAGDIFAQPVQALINPVNTVGVMGKELAIQFKNRYPQYFAYYQNQCASGELCMGTVRGYDVGEYIVVSFPTKKHWSDNSQLSDIIAGLKYLKSYIAKFQMQSIAIPALGCGLGSLQWTGVKSAIETILSDCPCDIIVLRPR